MSDTRRASGEAVSDDEGDSNAQYYSHLWTKTMKPRSAPKRVKHKRHLKKAMLLRNMLIGSVEHLARLHDKRIHTAHGPLRRG